MKLVMILPFKGVNNTSTEGHFLEREIMVDMEKRGQLEGVEIDIDEGYPTDYTAENRDEEVLAYITMGVLKKVREYSEMGKYDAIVTTGSLEPGFFAARMISKIPVACVLHSAVHVASLIGDRFSIIGVTDPVALILRHHVQNYGLSHKLASVRYVSHSSSSMMRLIHEYDKEERIGVPEGKKLVDDITTQCRIAIEEDRVDSLILSHPTLQCLEGEIRRRLDESGYSEIQLICEIPAAVEMAKAMVNLKLIQAPRAYPGSQLKAKPEFR